MNNELELARWIEGKTDHSSLLSGRTRTYAGRALADSQNGKVLVDLGGNIISEGDAQGIEIPCGPQVKEGDKVLVTTVNGSPYVSSVDGWGDYVGAQASFASAYIGALTAREITADRIQASVGYFGDLEAGNITADKLIANQATIDNLDTNYAHINNGVIDNAKIDQADVNNLDANYAKITNGVITNATIDQAKVNNLDTNYAKITNGVITNATIDQAKVNNLSANYAHINNGVIDNAKIDQADVNNLDANYAHITEGRIDNAVIDQSHVENLSNHYAHIVDGVIDNAKIDQADVNNLDTNYAHINNGVIDNAKIDQADVNNLDANYAKITNGVITNATIDQAKVNGLAATYATINQLQTNYITANAIATNYAQANFANVNNAWVENGVIRDGAISDAMINSVSANKLTAGTIDARDIIVTNLNAANITTGTLNGQRIGQGSLSLDKLEEDVYTEAEVNAIVAGLNERIDGAIETFTGTVVPTLNNYPANEWTTTKLRDQHVGDVYYVVNSESQQSGFCYRFTKSGNSYSWQLIKDSDVTAALSRLQTAEGKIGDIEEFDTDVSKWKVETDESLTEMQRAHTNLVTRVETAEGTLTTKVDQTTYNSLESTVNGHTTTIGSLTTTTQTLRTDVNSAQSAANAAQTTANSAIKSSVQLWYSKANTTAPDKPSAHVTSASTAGGDWRTVVPTYNASYPYYFYCYEYLYADGTYGWSAVVYDQATTESQQQARKGVADAAAAQSTANGAVTTANSAKSTAEGASADAATAVETANTANSNATTAVNTANTANSNATTAVNTANNANSNATAAVNTANTASSNATAAVNTANTANTNASNALNAAKSKYATSSTAASQAAKVASCSNFSLFSGADIYVKFTNENTAANPTLNVNNTGAKTILAADGSALDQASYWKAGETVHFAYNGSAWLAIESSAQEAASAVAAEVVTVKNNLNSVTDTVTEHTQKIGSLESTVATKADGSTVETIQRNLTTVTQDLSGFKTTVSSTYSTKAQLSEAIDSIEVGGRNLLPLVVSNDYIYTLNGIQMSIIGPSSIRINGTASATTVSDDIFGGLELDPGNYLLWMTNVQGDDVGFRLGHGPSRTHVYSSRGTYTRDNPYKFTVTETDSYWVRVIAWKDVTFDNFETRFMLEKGTIATDWTPAPEDMATSDEVEAAQTTANNALARAGMFKINMAERSFTTAQWKNYGTRGTATTWTTGSGYDNSKLRIGDTAYMTGTVTDGAGGTATIIGNVTAINGTTSVILVSQQLIFGGDALDTTFNRVVQAETKIDQNDEAITLTAEKIDSLQIGGRNLIAHTGDEPHLAFINAVETSDVYAGTPVIQMTGNTSGYKDLTISRLYILYKCRPNMDVVLSFWAKSSNPKESVSYFYNGSNNTTSVVDASMDTYRKGGNDGAIYYTIGSDWAKYWIHWKLSENTIDEYKSLIVCRLLPDADPTTVQFAAIKFEEGTRPTDWTPAPEDLATSAELTVANNLIASKVSSTDFNGAEMVSRINQSASSVVIDAAHVGINGTATFNAIKSSLDSNYDAKGAANTAVSNALRIPDTRSDNQPPSWYFTNYPRRAITEFKATSAIGLSGENYCYLTTVVPWGDASGGYPKQTAQVANKSYWRVGISASSWSEWQESETSAGASEKANIAEENAKNYMTLQLWQNSEPGYMAASGGTISAQSSAKERTTDYISVKASTKYILRVWYDESNPNSSYAYVSLDWFTSSKTWISEPIRAHVTDSNYYVAEVTSPTNAAYARISARWVESGYTYQAVIFEENVASEIQDVSAVANAAAPKSSAVARTQTIYISKASGTNSVSANTAWVTNSSDSQNTWTTKRPTYNSSYPVLFVATQSQTVAQSSGTTCSCTTPIKDDTTTIIDGGHITTGTIDASVVTVTNLDASEISTGTLSADRIAGGSLSISKLSDLSVGGRNLIGKFNCYFDEVYTGAGLTVELEESGWISISGASTRSSDGVINLWFSGNTTVPLFDPGYYTVSVETDNFSLTGPSGNGYRIQIYMNQDGARYLTDSNLTLSREFPYGISRISIYISSSAQGVAVDGKVRIKLEKGTVPTDWTPAPEDMVTNASFDVQNGKIIASVQSLAAGNSTYTDPSGNSATNGLYSKITQTAENLNITIASGTSYYATSTDAAGTAAKTATTMRDTNKPQAAFDLVVGVNVRVLFSQANTAASPTLNVDSKGAKPIRVNNAAIASGSPYNWAANTIVTFVYDGTYWQMSEATALGIASAGKATADELATIVRVYSGGVLTGKSGNAVGALVNSSGSFDVVPITWSGTTPTAGTSPLASFGSSSIKLGSSGYNMELTSSSLTFKNGTTVLQQITGDANTMYVSGKKRSVINSNGLTLYASDGSTVTGKFYAGSSQHGSDANMHVVETFTTTSSKKLLAKPTSAGWTRQASETWQTNNTALNVFTHTVALVDGDSRGPKITESFTDSDGLVTRYQSPFTIDNKFSTYWSEDDTDYENNSYLRFYSPGATAGIGNNVVFNSGSNMVIGGGEFALTAANYFPNLYDWKENGEKLYLGADGEVVIYSNTQNGVQLVDGANHLRYTTTGSLVNNVYKFDRSSTEAISATANTDAFLTWRDVNDEIIAYVGPWWPKAESGRGPRYTQLSCRTTGDANNYLSLGFDANDNRIVVVSSKPAWHSGLGLYTPKSLSGTSVITINSTCTLVNAYMRVSYAGVVTVYIAFKVKAAQAQAATVTVGTLVATTTDDNIYYINCRPNFQIRANVDNTGCLAAISNAGVVTFWNNSGASFAANSQHVITATYVTTL